MIFKQGDRDDYRCPTNPGQCVGEDCAAWRWAEPESEFHSIDVPAGTVTTAPDGWEFVRSHGDGDDFWAEPQSETTDRRHGYCGLAGINKLMAAEFAEVQQWR